LSAAGNKTQITVLSCANAVGTMLPPMVIFKGECFNYDWVKREVPDTVYGMSPNGWIDQDLFTKVVKETVYPQCSTSLASDPPLRWAFFPL